jgi:hypothetical protein
MPLIMHRTRNLGVTGVKGQYTVGPFISRDKSGGSFNMASVLPNTLTGSSPVSFVWGGSDGATIKSTGDVVYMVGDDTGNTFTVNKGDTIRIKWKGYRGGGTGLDSPNGTVLSGTAGDSENSAIKSYTMTLNSEARIAYNNKPNFNYTGQSAMTTTNEYASSSMNTWAFVFGTATGPAGEAVTAQFQKYSGTWKDLPASPQNSDFIERGDALRLRVKLPEGTANGDAYAISYTIGPDSNTFTGVVKVAESDEALVVDNTKKDEVTSKKSWMNPFGGGDK